MDAAFEDGFFGFVVVGPKHDDAFEGGVAFDDGAEADDALL